MELQREIIAERAGLEPVKAFLELTVTHLQSALGLGDAGLLEE